MVPSVVFSSLPDSMLCWSKTCDPSWPWDITAESIIYIVMKYLVLHVAGLMQTTIHVIIDDVFQKYTRYFLNNK